MVRGNTMMETLDDPDVQGAEEPRRSKRANKGNNSDRWQEVLDSARHNLVNPESVAGDTATDAGTVAEGDVKVHDSTEAQDDAIRCVCGQVTEVEDDDKTFIQCDQCSVWQHAPCVGLNDNNIPDQYFCERCRPDLHVELLRRLGKTMAGHGQIARSDRKRKRPNSRRESDEDHVPSDNDVEDDAIPDSPKRRRSISLSDVSIVSDASEDVVIRHRKLSKASQGRTLGAKGKTTESNVPKHKPDTKRARSPSAKPFTKVEQISDPTRKAIGAALIKMMEHAIHMAVSSEGFKLKGDPSVVARVLGLQIEFDLYTEHFAPTRNPEGYKAKYRQLVFNIKDPKNPNLRRRVIDKSIRTDALVKMSSADMANPEIKAMTEAVREEGLKQSVLVQDTGPRIRRTHKGEEYVEGPDAHIEQSGQQAPRSRALESERSPSVRSPSRSQSPQVKSPAESPSIPLRTERSRSGSNFDIKNVWSHIESPSGPEQSSGPERRPSANPQVQSNDEDLLEMLEEKTAASARYDYSQSQAVWRGKLIMPSISEAIIKTTLLGGPATFDIDWADLLSNQLLIDGRIPKPDATKYLCHQKHSKTKHVFALLLEAEGEKTLKTLYDYFIKKDRYGVLKMQNSRAKDGYIVPLLKGSAVPEFVSMLPVHNTELGGDVDKLLALLVVDRVPLQTAPPVVSKPENPEQKPADVLPNINTSMPASMPHIPSPAPSTQASQVAPISALNQHIPPHTQQYYNHHQQPPPMPETAEEAYARRAQLSRAPPQQIPQQFPPQLDSNAHAILGAFLRARPDVASNPQVTSNPHLMAQLLDEFVRSGALNR